MPTTMLFSPGRIVATPGALETVTDLQREGESAVLTNMLTRHLAGDWGDLCPQDKMENEMSLKTGCRLLSAYEVRGRKFWIITEADRSATTVLLPEEY